MPRTSKISSSKTLNTLQTEVIRQPQINGESKKLTSNMYFLQDEERDYSDSDDEDSCIMGRLKPRYDNYIYLEKPVKKKCDVAVQCSILTVEKSIHGLVTKCAELDPNSVGRYAQLVKLCRELLEDSYLISHHSDANNSETELDEERVVPQNVGSLKKSVQNRKSDRKNGNLPRQSLSELFERSKMEEATNKSNRYISGKNQEDFSEEENQNPNAGYHDADDRNDLRTSIRNKLSSASVFHEKKSESKASNKRKSSRFNGDRQDVSKLNKTEISMKNREDIRSFLRKSLSELLENSRIEVVADKNNVEILTKNREYLSEQNGQNPDTIDQDIIQNKKRKSDQKSSNARTSELEEESDSNNKNKTESRRLNGTITGVSHVDEEGKATKTIESIKSTTRKKKRRKSDQPRLTIDNPDIETENDNREQEFGRINVDNTEVPEANNVEMPTKDIEPVLSTNKTKNTTKSNKTNVSNKNSDLNNQENAFNHNIKEPTKPLFSRKCTRSQTINSESSNKKIEPTTNMLRKNIKRKKEKKINSTENETSDSDNKREYSKRLRNRYPSKTDSVAVSLSSEDKKLNSNVCINLEQMPIKEVFKDPNCLSDVKVRRGRGRPKKTPKDGSKISATSTPILGSRKTDSCIDYNSKSTKNVNGEERSDPEIVQPPTFMFRGSCGLEPDLAKSLARNWYNPNKSFSILEKSIIIDRQFLSLQLPKTRKLYSPSQWLDSGSCFRSEN